MMNGFILQENTSILISRNGKTLYSILHRSLDLTECCGDCFHFSTLHWLSLCSHLSNEIKGNILYWFCFLLWYFSDQLCRKSFVSSLWRLFSYSSRPDVDGLFTVGQKIASWGHSVIDTTKMIFLYGILFIMPLFF